MRINSAMKRRREGLGTPPVECPPVQKRQGLTEWTGRWSRGDRMLGSCVRLVAVESVQASVFEQTLELKVTRRWQGASGQADVW